MAETLLLLQSVGRAGLTGSRILRAPARPMALLLEAGARVSMYGTQHDHAPCTLLDYDV